MQYGPDDYKISKYNHEGQGDIKIVQKNYMDQLRIKIGRCCHFPKHTRIRITQVIQHEQRLV